LGSIIAKKMIKIMTVEEKNYNFKFIKKCQQFAGIFL